ncbi:MAG: flavin monoamine oxidase family protein [Planctomycetota bacterium]
MSRSPLFSALRRAIKNITLKNVNDDVQDRARVRVDTGKLTRRGFLAGAGTLAIGCAAAPVVRAHQPKIVIVGAGLAGLTAAFELQKNGLHAQLYEGSKRTGGRVFTARDLFFPGYATELGGEFIDSNHEDLLNLCDELDLEYYDLQTDDAALAKEVYFFEGKHYLQKHLAEELKPFAERLQNDADLCTADESRDPAGQRAAFDRMSISEYLTFVGVGGWLRELLDVAFLVEYGAEPGEQSALNFILLFDRDDDEDAVELYGESDERYKIRGGNARVTEELMKKIRNPVRTSHRLLAVEPAGHRYQLTFDTPARANVVETADFVILAIPIRMLRDVDLRVDLPKLQMDAIHEIGYGMSTKLLFGYEDRVWRKLGYSGNIYTDESLQCGWDHARLQQINSNASERGHFTYMLGGAASAAAGALSASHNAQFHAAGFARAFPRGNANVHLKCSMFHWPSYEFSRGGYSYYRPGHDTRFGGIEARPFQQIFFAGEHCSREFQGFMNGAVQTGKTAARNIIEA